MGLTTLLFFHVILIIVDCQLPSTKLIIKKLEFEQDNSILNATTRLDIFPNGSTEFSFHANVLVELREFLVQVGFTLSAGGNFKRPTMSVANICKYFKNMNGNMFVKIFFNAHTSNKSFPTSCPVPVGFYFMEGFQVNENFLKFNFIETKFQAFVNMCTKIDGKLRCFARSKTTGEIKDRQKWEKEEGARRT